MSNKYIWDNNKGVIRKALQQVSDERLIEVVNSVKDNSWLISGIVNQFCPDNKSVIKKANEQRKKGQIIIEKREREQPVEHVVPASEAKDYNIEADGYESESDVEYYDCEDNYDEFMAKFNEQSNVLPTEIENAMQNQKPSDLKSLEAGTGLKSNAVPNDGSKGFDFKGYFIAGLLIIAAAAAVYFTRNPEFAKNIMEKATEFVRRAV